jgi:tetratricopeptide (TPR) repeat protein
MIGLGLAGLFILVSLWWCLGAFFNADKQTSSLAVAILASLMANVAHAVGDFFWYTPSCMLLLAMQLACACRLYQITRETSGRSPWTWHIPRLLCIPMLGGVLALLGWMTLVKLPAAMAEPEQMRYIALSFAEPSLGNDEADHQESRQEMWLAATKAARLNPHHSRSLEIAAFNCLELFNERQSQTENSIPLAQLRDAVKASEFESASAMREWLDRAVGKNVKLLQLARKYFRQSLRESPLRAQAYVQLAELGFLDALDADTEMAYLKQALVLRKHDPAVLFAVGRYVSLEGDTDAAMHYWSEAFELSPMMRHKITELLVPLVSAEFFLSNIKPEWSALRMIARAFDTVGRQEEGLQIWQKVIDESTTSLKAAKTRREREEAFLAIYDAYVALNESDKAIKLLTKAHQQNPDSIPIRAQLAWGLYRTERYAEAAEHLVWLSSRNPADKSLQNAASKATKERMRTAGVSDPNS